MTYLESLVESAIAGDLNIEEIDESYQRIATVKNKYPYHAEKLTLAQKWALAGEMFPNREHKSLEQELSDSSMTLVKGTGKLSSEQKVHLLLPDEVKCMALSSAMASRFNDENISCASQVTMDFESQKKAIDSTNVLVVASIFPKQSLVELGGMEDISWDEFKKIDPVEQQDALHQLLSYAKTQNKKDGFY